MDDRFNRIESKIADISGTLTWIMRLVIGGILLAVLTFMIRGGFAP